MADLPILRHYRALVAGGGYIGGADLRAIHAFGERAAMSAQAATINFNSVDSAVEFKEAMLPGWFWRCGHGSAEPGWAHLNRVHPDHCDRIDEASGKAPTPAQALVVAVLNALIAIEESKHG
ncbi:hypothetical protein GCM10007301_15050 [Azorhizobium oxalatiphilum]|uniref:Uncharacterized protein n=1 Tax=Azorhizobium oxalatiphilum TaxID=980631 RepID=A0A917BRM7_9HYPH|nr:hypothetical protein [Azorhizobium oxalatiphilum]GGF56398.1 hypothetical protein GCM10007301_15050 [Azorhizobium oxalatiphilum]